MPGTWEERKERLYQRGPMFTQGYPPRPTFDSPADLNAMGFYATTCSMGVCVCVFFYTTYNPIGLYTHSFTNQYISEIT